MRRTGLTTTTVTAGGLVFFVYLGYFGGCGASVGSASGVGIL